MTFKKEKVNFVITGEFLTNISRTLWADDGEPEKALNILRSAFPKMKEADILSVVTGNKKLTGDSNTGCALVEDNATVSEHGNPLTLDRMIGKFRKKADECTDLIELATGQTARMASPHGLVEVPYRKTKSFGGVISRRVLKDGIDLESIPYLEVGHSEVTFSPSVDREEEKEVLPPARPKPKALNEIPENARDGWLTPEGKFYRCGLQGHITLAYALEETQNGLEEKDWIKLSAGKFYESYRTGKASQAQLDKIFDWCRATGNEMPWWTKDKE